MMAMGDSPGYGDPMDMDGMDPMDMDGMDPYGEEGMANLSNRTDSLVTIDAELLSHNLKIDLKSYAQRL